jgi:class 3 adenylate cyclase
LLGSEAGMRAWSDHDWSTAHNQLKALLRAPEAKPEQLEALAESAWWVGEIDDTIAARERAFAMYVDAHRDIDAARVAVQVAENHAHRLQASEARGWMRRAARLLDGLGETSELGHLRRLESVFAVGGAEGVDHALELAREVERIGKVTGDRDLEMLGLHDQGRFLVADGEVDQGFDLMEEAMVSVVTSELTPLVTGRIYCNMIEACASTADYKRASEWSDRAMRWCEEMGHAGGYPGVCRVRRSELMRLRGAWEAAEAEANRAAGELRDFGPYMAEAFHEIGLLRLHRGDLNGADTAFKRAHSLGASAMPGMAMAKVARGQADVAHSMIESVLEGAESPLARIKLLPGAVEIALEASALEQARQHSEELTELSRDFGSELFDSFALQAHARVVMAEGRPEEAVAIHRKVIESLIPHGLPYEIARARCDLGFSLIANGNEDLGRLELETAREEFERLGAATALDWLHRISLDGRRTQTTSAMMFTDIVDSTNLIGLVGDDAWADLVAWHDDTLRKLMDRHQGTEIDHAGDGFFISFERATDAVHCAIEIQRALRTHRRETGFSPRVRIGIHAGPVLESEKRLLGHNVHLAARIGSAAEGDEILISQATGAELGQGYRIEEMRTLVVKGIDEPVEVGSVAWS